MTGPEHYLKAEHLLAAADAYEQDGAPQTAASRRSEAQVHAMLAGVAAAVLATSESASYRTYGAWYRAVGIQED